MHNTNKILLVEDEEQLSRMLHSTLIQAGYEVSTARTGATALEHLVRSEFGVVLLDLGLPDIDGKQVIDEARTISHAPILVISARGSEKEKISALDMGASDYVAKPFDTGELLARIRVALRPRCCAGDLGHTTVAKQGLSLDFETRRAIIDGRSVRLSRKEAELLRVLADAEGAIVSHEHLIEAIWGRGSESDYMNLRVLTWQVRRKIEPDANVPQYLISEAGEGYRLKLD